MPGAAALPIHLAMGATQAATQILVAERVCNALFVLMMVCREAEQLRTSECIRLAKSYLLMLYLCQVATGCRRKTR
eukprot:6471148-Amphidinium_carterae.1